MNLVEDLHRHRRRVYSQNGEDGVIERLFDLVGTTNRYFVEFGTGPAADECNTRLLREREGWSGILMDRFWHDPSLPCFRELVTAENLNDLFEKYGVPESFDLLSIDIDGNDYWIWKALAPHYRPRVVVIEYNGGIPADVPVVMPYAADYLWRGEPNVGQSLAALQKLSAQKGYSLVYAYPPNAVLVRADLLPGGYREVSPKQAARLGWGHMSRHRFRWKHELRHLPWVYV